MREGTGTSESSKFYLITGVGGWLDWRALLERAFCDFLYMLLIQVQFSWGPRQSKKGEGAWQIQVKPLQVRSVLYITVN